MTTEEIKTGFNWRLYYKDIIMLATIITVILFAYAFGRWSASCEINAIEEYIDKGGQIVINSSGMYDLGQKVFQNLTVGK